MAEKRSFRQFVLASLFAALIIVMTVVPYLGYINYGLIEITTLHIVVTLGAVCLGWKYGALLGGVWGVTCLLRAFTNPAWLLFTNPLI
ncbi:MAG: ECF transporter S component, partial [Oscillospiraceae bacterium]